MCDSAKERHQHAQQQRLQQQAKSDTRQAKARRFDAVMKKPQPMPKYVSHRPGQHKRKLAVALR
jgi:hypothetical protein